MPEGFNFWGPQPQPLDFSPITRGAEAGLRASESRAAAYAAIGQSVGQGLSRAMEERKQTQLQETTDALVQNLSNAEFYEEKEWVPAEEEFGEVIDSFRSPETGKLEGDGRAMATEFISRAMQSRHDGLDKWEADRIATRYLEPQPIRYLTKEGNHMLVQNSSQLAAALAREGIDPNHLSGPIQQALGGAAMTEAEARQRSMQEFQNAVQPTPISESTKIAKMGAMEISVQSALAELQMAKEDHARVGNEESALRLREAEEVLRRSRMMLEHDLGMERVQEQGRLTSSERALDRALAREETAQRLSMTERELAQRAELSEKARQHDFKLSDYRFVQDMEKQDAMLRASLDEARVRASGLEPAEAFVSKMASEGILRAVGGAPVKPISMTAAELPIIESNDVLKERLRNAGWPGLVDIADDELQKIKLRVAIKDGQPHVVAHYDGSPEKSKAAQAVIDAVPSVAEFVGARQAWGAANPSRDQLIKTVEVMSGDLGFQLYLFGLGSGEYGGPKAPARAQPAAPAGGGDPFDTSWLDG